MALAPCLPRHASSLGALFAGIALLLPAWSTCAADPSPPVANRTTLTLAYEEPHWLVIRGAHLPGGELRVNYLEAYCRGDSTDADWNQHTVIPFRTESLGLSADRKTLRLRDALADGLTVEHLITAGDDEVDFQLTAHNPSSARSAAQWAQPCVRLSEFTGYAANGNNLDDYLPKGFVFYSGKLVRLHELEPWATQARYTPGQVWRPRNVPVSDLNPRPLSELQLDNGLIGAFSADESLLYATAWEPYQELFQGVARCLHVDFRLGGLQPNEQKTIRGKIYLVANDVPALLKRYAQDFPEHQGPLAQSSPDKDLAKAPEKPLPLPGEVFLVDGAPAFLIAPPSTNNGAPVPWVWYAPTLPGTPGPEEGWMFARFIKAGIAVAGVDVGDTYGSPMGRQLFSAFYEHMTQKRGLAPRPIFLGRSRGGLQALTWAVENPSKVGGFAGVYPVCNLESWPGLEKASGPYGMTTEELRARLADHNPLDRLAGLAREHVPLFAIHGDLDKTVPLEANSGALAQRYQALGGTMELVVPKGQGHTMWPGFFQSQELVDFVNKHAASHAAPPR